MAKPFDRRTVYVPCESLAHLSKEAVDFNGVEL
jgi:hypothetical protein